METSTTPAPEGALARKRLVSQPRRRGRPHLSIVSARIDSAVLAAVSAAAERQGVSRSAFVSDALRAWINGLPTEAAE
jgi:predicted HicB family RNase H-like nuclease